MLKIRHSNTAVSYCKSPLTFDLPNERYIAYLLAMSSPSEAAKSLRKKLEAAADSNGMSYESVLRILLAYKVQYWQFNFTKGEEVTINALADKYYKSFAKEKSSTMPIDDREMIRLNGENVSIEDMNRTMYVPKSMIQLSSDYKEYFYGIYYVTKKIMNTFDHSSVIKVLYCKWLHMINNRSEGFLRSGMITGDYSNAKRPNAIVGQYSNNSGKTGEDIDNYTREYLDTHGNKELSVSEFYKDIYTILTQILGYTILDPSRKYQSREVDEEYTKLYKDGLKSDKFSLEFLNKTQNIENWKELTLEDVENEYKISEFYDPSINISKEIPPLKPVLSFPAEQLKNDYDLMRMLHLRYRLNTHNISDIYNMVYTLRLSKLRNNVNTHEIFRKVKNVEENDDKEVFDSESENKIGLNLSGIPEKILKFKLEYLDSSMADDITTEILNKVKSQLFIVANNLYSRFENASFNVKEMDSLFAYNNLYNEILGTITEQNGILYAMGKPVVVTTVKVKDPLASSDSDNKTLPDYYYVTSDGLLINDNYILRPKRNISDDSIYSIKNYMVI